MSEKKKPAYIARAGSVRVPVYRTADGRFYLAYRLFNADKRRQEIFREKAKAVERADEVALAISNSQADVLTLTSADRDNYRLAVLALAPLGIPLHAAISEFVEARRIAGGISLIDAAQFYAKERIEKPHCPPTVKVVEMLMAQLADDRRSDVYTGQLGRDLEAFAKFRPNLTECAEDCIREYLRGLKTTRGTARKPAGEPVSARRRDNVREAIMRLLTFARAKKLIAKDVENPVDNIPRLSTGSEVSTYSPTQLSEILGYFSAHDTDWLPWAALAAFAGMRTSEVLRLDWSAIKWDAQTIAVPGKVAKKVRISRQTPLLPALQAWLAPYRLATGPVIPDKWGDKSSAQCDALKRLRRDLKWKTWDNNALRHSFGSYRLAIVKSYAQVSLEMGNSPAKVREHYNDPKPEAEAAAYFAIMPGEAAGKITPFRGATGAA